MTPADELRPFADPHRHAAISAIIRERSLNRIDIREAALEGLDLSRVEQILDLGCGFGFMGAAVAQRAAPSARLVGVDAAATNEQHVLERVRATGREASFKQLLIDTALPWPDRSFDLVLCSYTLYFFVAALPEIARVLRDDGLLLAITHSERSFKSLYQAAALDEARTGLAALVREFSAENGEALLRPWFQDVERRDYPNALRFESNQLDELLSYVEFKLPLLDPESGERLSEPMRHALQAWFEQRNELVVEKDDAVFRCRRPRCR